MSTIPMFLQPHEIRAALAADAEEDAMALQAQRDAERAHQAGLEAAAAQVAADAAAAIVAEYTAAEPPDGDVDVTGLAPQRARLVRYHAWVKSLESDLANRVAGRAGHLADMGVKVATKAALDALIKSDTTGMVAAMAKGQGMNKQQLRGIERAQLEKKLVHDTHAAEVSRMAMNTIEREIDAITAQLDVLTGRESEFISDALEEHVVETAGPKLLAAVAEVRDTEMQLLAATAQIQAMRGISYAQQTRRAVLPTPRMHIPGVRGAASPGHVISGTSDVPIPLDHAIEWPVHEQIQVQRRMAELAKQLAADPRALLGTN